MTNLAEFPKEAYDYFENQGMIQKAYAYMTDRKARKSVLVAPWLRKQIENATQEEKDLALKITKHYNSDNAKAIAILRWVKANFQYNGDKKLWGMLERWQTASESLTRWYEKKNGQVRLVYTGYDKPPISRVFRSGDCEDGSCLIYVLCRLAGIPDYKLLFMCGDVVGGGHAYLAFRPQPHWFVNLDWCYWYNNKGITKRPKFFIQGTEIYGEDSRYINIWFCFNERKSFVGFKPTIEV